MRALRVLGEVQLIAAEDTRTSRKLLNRYDIKTRLTSYFEHNKKNKMPLLLETLEEQDIALISEAGMPGISDPGYELIKGAIDKGLQVVVLPGPSAVTTAVAASGLPADQFVYLGFLPRKKGRKAAAAGIGERRTTDNSLFRIAVQDSGFSEGDAGNIRRQERCGLP